jgi:bifunctional pyridoxal-dependent enzyme with beta-cystathionase and maltose regulon repressor activities
MLWAYYKKAQNFFKIKHQWHMEKMTVVPVVLSAIGVVLSATRKRSKAFKPVRKIHL